MATDRYFVCGKCKTQEWADSLFDTLKDHANGVRYPCSECQTELEIQLTFNFGLDAGPHPCKVLDVFLPATIHNWPRESGATVEFYPFLVMVESLDEGYASAWLPYWHLVKHPSGGVKKKYGQWAPFIDLESYVSLVQKARDKGYIM